MLWKSWYRNAKCSNNAMFAHQFCQKSTFCQNWKTAVLLQLRRNSAGRRHKMPSTWQYPPNRKFHVVYKTCVQHDNLASESSSIAKSLQCVLTKSDVFAGPRNFQYLLVFDQTLCQNVTKVLNLTGCMLFSVSYRFIIIFEPVRYRNAKQCICLEFVQRFQQNDVLTWSNDFSNFTHFRTRVKWYQQKSAQSHHMETFRNLISFMFHALKIVISKR